MNGVNNFKIDIPEIDLGYSVRRAFHITLFYINILNIN